MGRVLNISICVFFCKSKVFRQNVFTTRVLRPWHRLPGEAVAVLSLEVLEVRLGASWAGGEESLNHSQMQIHKSIPSKTTCIEGCWADILDFALKYCSQPL